MNEVEIAEVLAALRRWWLTAEPWLDRNPAQAQALDDWEREHVTGDGTYGTSDWPGWASSPMGRMPKPTDFLGTVRHGGRRQ